jgi:CRISPR/Cas system CSM-associated protein Csm3 (group 7 of RAMP superfamily)
MARRMTCRYELSARLRVVAALAVGSGAEERGVDLALARDGRGRLYVPGTSLAGALRTWNLLPTDQARERGLWGWRAEDDTGQGWASRIQVDDGLLQVPAGAPMEEIRDGVAIDRRTGAAAGGFKYERAVVPAGSEFVLRLACEVEPEHEAEALALLQEIRVGLRTGRLWLGAARSRGLGRVELVEGSDRLCREQMGTREEMLAALRRRVGGGIPGPEEVPAPTEVRLAQPRELRFWLSWRPIGPLMVRAGGSGLGVDSLPLTTVIGEERALLLPGASIKGAIRARAERIVRTLLDSTAPRELPGQLVPHPLIGWIFGCPPSDPAQVPERRSDLLLPGLAALWVGDCRSRTRVPGHLWTQVESTQALGEADVEDGKGPALRQILDGCPQLRAWDPAVHVAIDRWTGGAAQKRLFSILEPHGVEWNPIEMVVHLERLPTDLHEPAAALLLAVLDDLSRGEVPLGFATNRGLGDMEVEEVEIAVWGGGQLSWLAGRHRIAGRGLLAALEAARPAQLAALRNAWGHWLASQSPSAPSSNGTAVPEAEAP